MSRRRFGISTYAWRAARQVAKRALALVGREHLWGPVLHYRGYRIPSELVNLTGGGADTWDSIGQAHLAQYARYAPIAPDHAVFELGCGVGRDAILLTGLLGPRGSYTGVDLIAPSIRWCRRHIGARHPNFQFVHFDARSQLHNPRGRHDPAAVTLPAADASIDRIIAQSVFTHMFEGAIFEHLWEFRRVLRPDGLAVVSFFLLDDGIRERVKDQDLHFRHPHGDGCYVVDPAVPEAAVAYTLPALERMIRGAGLELVGEPHRGFWSGHASPDGQDVVVLQAARTGSAAPR